MKNLTVITGYREVRRDPISYIELNTEQWLIQTSSMPPENGGGLTPPWFSTQYAQVLMHEDWTEAERNTYLRTFRNKGIVLELEDDDYDFLTARIRNGSVSVSPAL